MDLVAVTAEKDPSQSEGEPNERNNLHWKKDTQFSILFTNVHNNLVGILLVKLNFFDVI